MMSREEARELRETFVADLMRLNDRQLEELMAGINEITETTGWAEKLDYTRLIKDLRWWRRNHRK